MGIVKRIQGFFTFINILWLASIIGSNINCKNLFYNLLVTVSIGPCTYDLLKPLREYLKLFLKKLWKKVIVPFFEMLHNRGILEFTCYYASTYFVVEGFRMIKEIGYFITLTGMALVIPSYSYSCLRHLKKLRMSRKQKDIFKMISMWLASCFSCLVYYQI